MTTETKTADALIDELDQKKEALVNLTRHRAQKKAEQARVAKEFREDVKEIDAQIESTMEEIELLQMQVRAKDEEARIRLPEAG